MAYHGGVYRRRIARLYRKSRPIRTWIGTKTSNATVNADTVAAVASIPSPTNVIDATLDAGTVAAIAAIDAPVIPVTFDAGTVVAITAIDAPSISTVFVSTTVVALAGIPSPSSLVINVVVAAPTLEAILSFDRRRRVESVRFEVVGPTGQRSGILHPDEDRPPSLDHNVNQPIMRRLTDLHLPVSEANALNPYTDRIRLVWIFPEVPIEFSLGLYMVADLSRPRYSFGTMTDISCMDQGMILNYPVEDPISYEQYASCSTIIAEQAEAAGIFEVNIEATNAQIGTPIAEPPGSNRLTVMNRACAAAGFFPVYFDNNGVLVARSATNLAYASTPTLKYDGADARIDANSIVESDDTMEAPNRYKVIATGITDQPVYGTFDVPDDAPFSIANTGKVRPKIIEITGVTDQAAAALAAQAAYATDSATYRWASWTSPVDPRHDTFDLVSFLQEFHREQEWSIRGIRPGAVQAHVARRVYA